MHGGLDPATASANIATPSRELIGILVTVEMCDVRVTMVDQRGMIAYAISRTDNISSLENVPVGII